MEDTGFNPNLPSAEQQMTSSSPPVLIGDTITQAWKLVGGSKGVFFATLVTYFAVMIFSRIVQQAATDSGGLIQLAIQLVTMGLGMCLAAAGYVMGIRRARGENISFAMIGEFFPMLPTLFAAGILITILIGIGLCIFILPGIYLVISYGFAIALIAEKKLPLWEALETSRKVVHQNWFGYFGIYLVLGIIVSLSAIPFGIGLIWTLPLAYICFGILYNKAFADMTV